jgi:hypothetical protein
MADASSVFDSPVLDASDEAHQPLALFDRHATELGVDQRGALERGDGVKSKPGGRFGAAIADLLRLAFRDGSPVDNLDDAISGADRTAPRRRLLS